MATRLKDALKRHGLALTFDLHPWQLQAVWRGLVGGNTIFAHDVGAGKTFEMIATAMAWRKTGRARKPMIVVPNATMPGWRKAILEAYPAANVLLFDKSDLAGKKRQEAMARIAYGDWDLVLVPHSSFKLLAVKKEAMAAQLNEWVDAARQSIQDQRTGELDKEGEKQLNRMTSRIKKLLADTEKGQDENITWEHLGVDGLIIDEAHQFKNLFMFSSLDKISGLASAASARALDLLIKVQTINNASGERNLIFGTATPVMNSVAEIFTFQRFMQPSVLKQHGTEAFDSWYSMFLQSGPARLQRPDGSYKEITKIIGYNNLRTLRKQIFEVLDYVGTKELETYRKPDGELMMKRPTIKGGAVEVIENPPHPQYNSLIVPWFKKRQQNIKETPPRWDPRKEVYIAPPRPHPITGADMPNKDNQLTIINDARLATVDPRLITGLRDIETYDKSRLKMVADELVPFYHETTEAKANTPAKAASLVFLDVGTPAGPSPLEFLAGVDVQSDDTAAGSTDMDAADKENAADEAAEGFIEMTKLDLYEELRQELVRRGIPSNEIAYVHQTRNETESTALYDAVNSGKVRILVGSTKRGGEGVNVQERLGLMVLMDVPRDLRPGDEKQRIGRIVRQGNSFDEVRVVRFVSPGTSDEWLYSVMHGKARNIESFYRGETDTFEEVDISASEKDYEVAQRFATKDPRALELMDLKDEQVKLKARADAEDQQKLQAAEQLDMTTRAATRARQFLATVTDFADAHDTSPLDSDAAVISVAGKPHTGSKAATKAILAIARTLNTQPVNATTTIPIRVHGMPMTLDMIARSSSQHVDTDDGKTEVKQVRYVRGELNDDLINEGVASWSTDESWEIRPANQIINWFNKFTRRMDSAQDRADSLAAKVRKLEQAAGGQTSSLRVDLQRITDQVNDIELAFLAESNPEKAEPDDDAPTADDSAAGSDSAAEKSVGNYAVQIKEGGIGITPNPAATATIDGTVVSPLELPELVELATELGASVQSKAMGAETRGTFKGPGAIALRLDLFRPSSRSQLTAVLAHELGHLVDWISDNDIGTLKRGNLLGHLGALSGYVKHTLSTPNGEIRLAPIKAELQALSLMWRPWKPDEASAVERKYRNAPKELYADALSALLVNPQFVQTQAPQFWEAFFAGLDNKVDVKDHYFRLQELMAGDRGKLLAHRQTLLKAGFGKAATKSAELQAQRAKASREAYWNPVSTMNHMIDNTYALEHKLAPLHLDPEQDPLLMLKSLNHVNMRPFTREVVEPIVTELRDAEIPLDTFGSILFYRRIADGDRSNIFNPGGTTPEAAAEGLDAAMAALRDDQQEVLTRNLDRLYRAMKAVQADAHKAGLYDERLADIMAKSESYVPFQVIDYIDKSMTHHVHAQKGTGKEIANPFVSAVIKMLVTKREIGINTAKSAAVSALRTHFGTEITDAKIKTWALKDGGVRRETVTTTKPGEGLVWLYEDGKAKAVVVDEYISQSINRLTEGHMLAAVRLMNALHTKIFRRLHITHNPAFFLFNTIRDMPRMWRNNPRMGFRTIPKDWVDVMRAVPAAVVRAAPDSALARRLFPSGAARIDAAERAGILGPLMRSDYLLGRAPDYDQVEALVDRLISAEPATPPTKTQQLKRAILGFVGAVEKTGNFFEAWTKVAGIVNAERAYGGIEDIPADERQRIRSDYGTHDFSAGGVYGSAMQSIFLYSNAMVQGTRADWKVASQPKTRAAWWWKMAAFTLSRKALQAAAYTGAFHAALVGLGFRDDDDYDWIKAVMSRMSEYDRMFYDLMPLGLDSRGRGWAIRIPTDYFGRMIGAPFTRAVEAMLDDKDDQIATLVQEMAQDFIRDLPNASPVIDIAIDTTAFVIGENPYDNFRQRNLFTTDEMLAGGWEKWQKFGRYLIQQSGTSAFIAIDLNGNRPKRPAGAEAIFDFPVIGPTLGRLLRRTDYGLTELAREAQDPVKRQEAQSRLSTREFIHLAVQQYMDLPDAEHTIRTRGRLSRETARAAATASNPSTFADWKAIHRRVERQVNLSLAFEDAAPLTSSIAQAATTAQAVAAARAVLRAGVTREKLHQWLFAARSTGILSKPRLQAVFDGLKEGT